MKNDEDAHQGHREEHYVVQNLKNRNQHVFIIPQKNRMK
jgi:hypothetical protein